MSRSAFVVIVIVRALGGPGSRVFAARVDAVEELLDVELEEATADLSHSANRSEQLVNDPSHYVSYIKPIAEAIVGNKQEVLQVKDYDDDDAPKRSGTILFNLVGSCPTSLLCDNQAVTFSSFSGEVASYWSKPHEIMQCTRNRHVAKGKCKNDSDRFEKLEKLFSPSSTSYSVTSDSPPRAVITAGSEQLFVYMIYVSDWSTWKGTMQGWILFQKARDGQEYFRQQFKCGKDMKINVQGEPKTLRSFWPEAEEVQV